MREKSLKILVVLSAFMLALAGTAAYAGEEAPPATDSAYYLPVGIQSAGFWENLTVQDLGDGGTRISFTDSTYVTIRTTSSVSYGLDGLHLRIENFSGDGLGIAFSNLQSPDAGESALRFFAFNAADHTGVMRASYPTWESLRLLGELIQKPIPASFDIRMDRSTDGSWTYRFNGQEFVLSAEDVASAVSDPAEVYVSFSAYGGSGTIDSYRFDLASVHGGESKCADDLTGSERSALASVEEKIGAIGKVSPTEACRLRIESASSAYLALDASLQTMVRHAKILEAAMQNYYVLGHPQTFDQENILSDFYVLSDNHLDTNGCTSYEDGSPLDRFVKAMEMIGEKKPDALLLTGDMTDWARFDDSEGLAKARKQINMFKDAVEGTLDPETSLFFTYGNHDSSESTGNSRVDLFREILGDGFYAQDVNKSDPMWQKGYRHAVIAGFDYLTFEWDYTDENQNLSREALDWIARELETITSAPVYTNRPIFLLSHVPFSDTVYGSGSRPELPNKLKLYEILARYPQLVMLTGHSHYPLNHEQFIHQSDFTSLSAATTAYICMDGKGFLTEGGYKVGEELMPEDLIQSQGLRLEIDADYNVRVTRIDFLKGGKQIYNSVIISSPDMENKTHLNYFTDARESRYDAPAFPEEAKLKVEALSETDVAVTFDTILCESLVQYYVVDVEQGGETLTFKSYAANWRYPSLDLMPVQKTVVLEDLALDRPYTVRVRAVDSYGNASGDLVTVFRDEEALNREKAAAVEALIQNIGEVNLEAGDRLEAARAAYEALNYDQKKLVSNADVLFAAVGSYDDLFIGLEQHLNKVRTERDVVGTNFWLNTGELAYRNDDKGIFMQWKNAVPNTRMGLRAFDLDGLHLTFDRLEKSPEMPADKAPCIGFILGGSEHPLYTEPDKTGILLFLDTASGRLESHPGYKTVLAGEQLKYENLVGKEFDLRFTAREEGGFLVEMAGLKGILEAGYFDGSFSLKDISRTYLSISDWVDGGSFSLRLMSAHDRSGTCYPDDRISFEQIGQIGELEETIDGLGEIGPESGEKIALAEQALAQIPEQFRFLLPNAAKLKEAREAYDRLPPNDGGGGGKPLSGWAIAGISAGAALLAGGVVLLSLSLRRRRKP